MRHDNCYTLCSGSVACIKQCDKTLADELRDLASDPRDWPKPPPVGTEGETLTFRDGAIDLFDPPQNGGKPNADSNPTGEN